MVHGSSAACTRIDGRRAHRLPVGTRPGTGHPRGKPNTEGFPATRPQAVYAAAGLARRDQPAGEQAACAAAAPWTPQQQGPAAVPPGTGGATAQRRRVGCSPTPLCGYALRVIPGAGVCSEQPLRQPRASPGEEKGRRGPIFLKRFHCASGSACRCATLLPRGSSKVLKHTSGQTLHLSGHV